ncbi:hypothetical protein PSQ20_16520 [Curvibacter sp. RS43]|uniref:DUF3862 domain-containing protein n=1 Tax=Curvibacter microcysteis TaxID=3026419 RepID=A0ABT5MJH1_9BURK|nr:MULTISPECIES: hypothetical protein [unclassified Curvibacter]MDD0811963.1 hypothetical protein [Curvibacter sp. RS43]MDD0816728.1 hypothetical protein [Curvibacter sp. HBC28]
MFHSPRLLRVMTLGFVGLGAALVLSACGSQLSLANYNRLQVGQSFEEVKQIVGEPASCDEALGVRSCLWGDAERNIRINFALGKVLLLSAQNLK